MEWGYVWYDVLLVTYAVTPTRVVDVAARNAAYQCKQRYTKRWNSLDVEVPVPSGCARQGRAPWGYERATERGCAAIRPKLTRHVPLPRAAAARLPAPERLDRYRSASLAAGHRRLARARPHARRAPDHLCGGSRHPVGGPGSARKGVSRGMFPIPPGGRRHPYGDRAAPHRARGRGGGPAPHRALA